MSHNLEFIHFPSLLEGGSGKGDSKHLQNSTRQLGGDWWDRITRTLNQDSKHANSTRQLIPMDYSITKTG